LRKLHRLFAAAARHRLEVAVTCRLAKIHIVRNLRMSRIRQRLSRLIRGSWRFRRPCHRGDSRSDPQRRGSPFRGQVPLRKWGVVRTDARLACNFAGGIHIIFENHRFCIPRPICNYLSLGDMAFSDVPLCTLLFLA
jgi:hypothetical protein